MIMMIRITIVIFNNYNNYNNYSNYNNSKKFIIMKMHIKMFHCK